MILEDDGVEALYRATTASSFPSDAGAGYLVCVKAADKEKARTSIEALRKDGVVTLDGTFL